MKFACSSCGLCCKKIGQAIQNADKQTDPDYKRLLQEFPYEVTESGACSKLGADGKCTVYKGRPLLCNVYHVWKKIIALRDNAPTEKQFYLQNAEICNKMIAEEGLPKSFLINTSRYK